MAGVHNHVVEISEVMGATYLYLPCAIFIAQTKFDQLKTYAGLPNIVKTGRIVLCRDVLQFL